MVHSADIKFGDLVTNTDCQTFNLVDWPRDRYKILPQRPFKNSIGDELCKKNCPTAKLKTWSWTVNQPDMSYSFNYIYGINLDVIVYMAW